MKVVRLVLCAFLTTASGLVWSGGGEHVSATTGMIGTDRIVSMKALPDGSGEMCEVPTSQTTVSRHLSAAGQGQAASGAVAEYDEAGRRSEAERVAVAERQPLRTR